MPTGYTAAIADGATFEQFVWRSARAMGALVMLRDAPSDATIPERFEPSQWYAQRAATDRAELLRIEALTPAEADAAAQAAWDEAFKARALRNEQKEALRVRYEMMLTQVRDWHPPTPDHVGFKSFMIEQLNSSIDFDCNTKYDTLPTPLRGDEWRADKIRSLRESISRAEQDQREENERTESRNRWLADLRKSVAQPS